MRVGPNPITHVFIRKEKAEHRHREGRPCEDRGRGWSEASTSQGTVRNASNDQERGRGRFSLRAFKDQPTLPTP